MLLWGLLGELHYSLCQGSHVDNHQACGLAEYLIRIGLISARGAAIRSPVPRQNAIGARYCGALGFIFEQYGGALEVRMVNKHRLLRIRM